MFAVPPVTALLFIYHNQQEPEIVKGVKSFAAAYKMANLAGENPASAIVRSAE